MDGFDHRMNQFAQALQTILQHTAHLQSEVQQSTAAPQSPALEPVPVVPAHTVHMTLPQHIVAILRYV
ncbi:Hypothetical predicted protein, partial [Pelobates cultripes]